MTFGWRVTRSSADRVCSDVEFPRGALLRRNPESRERPRRTIEHRYWGATWMHPGSADWRELLAGTVRTTCHLGRVPSVDGTARSVPPGAYGHLVFGGGWDC